MPACFAVEFLALF